MLKTIIDILEVLCGFYVFYILIKYAIKQRKNRVSSYYERDCILYYELIDPIVFPYCLYVITREYSTYESGKGVVEIVVMVIGALCLLRIDWILEKRIEKHQKQEEKEKN